MGNFSEKQQQLLGEVPFMMAFRAKGFTLNVGVKFQVNLWQKTMQTLYEPNIDAYYVDADIHVPNELIIGVVDEADYNITNKWAAPSLGVAISCEMGYEWRFKQKGIVGLQAFVDYSIWNDYKCSGLHVIDVAPISLITNPVAKVTIDEVSQSLVPSVRPLTFGLKLYLGLDILAKKEKSHLEEEKSE